MKTLGSLGVALALVLGLGAGDAAAQDYPNRPIKVIVPFPPGGGVDTVSRLLGQEMSKSMGQPVVIENKPGAAGTIGANAAAKSDSDGYTLVMVPGGHPLYGATYKSLPFDTVKSFDWISTLVTLQFFVAVPADSPFKSMQNIITTAKATPQTVTFGSAGAGSTHHLTGEMIGMRTGAKLLHVPYQGDAAAVNALLGNQINFTLATPTLVIGNVQAGKLRALATTGNTRSAKLPDVPTMEQALGIKDFDVRTWFGLAAPAGLPRPVLARLNAEVHKALTIPEMRAKLEQIGGEVAPSTPEEMRDRVARELAMWTKIVEEAKIPKQ